MISHNSAWTDSLRTQALIFLKLISAMSVAAPVKKRRIQPVAVEDDEVPAAQLPPAQNAASAAALRQPIAPPSPGRRIVINLSDGYDFNWRKLLAARGIKVPSAHKRARVTDANNAASDKARDLVDALASDRGVGGCMLLLPALQLVFFMTSTVRNIAIEGANVWDAGEQTYRVE